MSRAAHLTLRLLVALVLLAGLLPGSISTAAAAPTRQDQTPEQKAAALLANMTPEERVGQLFLVTFQGSGISPDSVIYDLITRYHVGGVVLQRTNDNFAGEQTAAQIAGLVRDLQNAEWAASQPVADSEPAPQAQLPTYIPLWIAVQQDGNGAPGDQILSGVTTLPSAMALGATWQPDLARQTGQILGQELSALGFNLLLGPSLDVHQQAEGLTSRDLGVQVFGGDPYWVGQIGSAYISGIHEGSQGRISVVSRHFPGMGASDRAPTDEVGTVRKTLEQLQQFDLPPFFTAAGDPAQLLPGVDGFLVSHIRYLFQGNIRATTRPVSLDGTALGGLLALPHMQAWQRQGGLLVSDDLGSRAVRRFYDPSEQSFDPRQVVREAFLAGNDLLFVSDLSAGPETNPYDELVKTLQFFARKYNDDTAFAERVNQSALRILTQKQRIYPQFVIDSVQPSAAALDVVGANLETEQVLFRVAHSAVTRLEPTAAELPPPPSQRDRLVFITDTRTTRQCSTCPEIDELPVDAFQNAVLRLYGPQAGGLVTQSRMSSYTYADLLIAMNNATLSTPAPSALEADLLRATWVIFASLTPEEGRQASGALLRMLNERADLIANKQVVVFAFEAPDFLDATDISKLTAFYALYSHTSPFIDAAARALFQEVNPPGASPISVPGAGYDLNEATSPDPNQVIRLAIEGDEVLPTAETPTPGQTAPVIDLTPTAETYEVGSRLSLIAGPVLDRNGRFVPDGTVVRFLMTTDGGAGGSQQFEAQTQDAMARVSYTIERPGLLEIRAVSEKAAISEILRANIPQGESGVFIAITPTSAATATPTPTLTPTPTPTPEPTPTPVPPFNATFGDWALAVLLTAFAGGLTYVGGLQWSGARWAVRWALCAILGGLAGYTYLVLELPGGSWLVETTGTTGVLLLTLLGIALGLALGWLWWNSQRGQRRVLPSRALKH